MEVLHHINQRLHELPQLQLPLDNLLQVRGCSTKYLLTVTQLFREGATPLLTALSLTYTLKAIKRRPPEQSPLVAFVRLAIRRDSVFSLPSNSCTGSRIGALSNSLRFSIFSWSFSLKS